MSDHDPDFAVDPENLMNENSSLEIRKKQDTRNSAAVSTMENPDLEREEIIMLTSIISDRDFRSTQRQEQSMFLDPEDIKPFEPLKSVMAKRTTFYSSASFLITESSHKCDQTDPSTYKAFPEISGIVAEDFSRINARQVSMVERAKKKLTKLFQEYIYNPQEDSSEIMSEDESSTSLPKSDLALRFPDTYDPIQQKASLDWRVVALFDDYMVKEAKREVAGHPIVKKIQGEAAEEFLQQQKEAENQVALFSIITRVNPYVPLIGADTYPLRGECIKYCWKGSIWRLSPQNNLGGHDSCSE
ncbi:unnamed protein product [Acanthoscelides obtectus]|uniref:Uncharacterized protein n=1 Tax=Acanthoscelides obtectus TaxID=200917 RepID=A0A9P0KQJ8_ACAOB|nr:unnamed protein product [Acanthoscelides obtectus]CAK1674925.1 hypothetical protein AOBTE_LOCUS29815 [Acanthoscelides obtectus]